MTAAPRTTFASLKRDLADAQSQIAALQTVIETARATWREQEARLAKARELYRAQNARIAELEAQAEAALNVSAAS